MSQQLIPAGHIFREGIAPTLPRSGLRVLSAWLEEAALPRLLQGTLVAPSPLPSYLDQPPANVSPLGLVALHGGCETYREVLEFLEEVRDLCNHRLRTSCINQPDPWRDWIAWWDGTAYEHAEALLWGWTRDEIEKRQSGGAAA